MITTSKSAKIIPHIVLIILTLVCLLPLLLLLMASLTDEQTLMLNGYSFFPEKFSADAYTYIFKTGKTVLRAYVPGVFHIYYDAHSKGASAWMHLIVSHAMIVYTNDRI